jgi:predicted nucleotidyltransferase
MRLTPTQVATIKTATIEIFGPDARVWLFGSRVDDEKRGGDIDLYLELPGMESEQRSRLETRFWIRLQRALGERKIDIVTHQQGSPLRPIDQQARTTGVQL